MGVPFRKIREVLGSLGSISISSGAIQQGMIRLATLFTGTYLSLIEALRKANVVHADETGWKMDGLGECRRGSSTDPDVERLKNRMSIFRDEFLTFLTEPGVEPDNNRAERAIRPGVVFRKISGGNRSEKGAEAHAILMSIIQTCRQQGTTIMEYGMSVLAARNVGKPDPALVRS